MIDISTATNYLKQVIEQLELKEDELHKQELAIETEKKTLVQAKSDLTASKSAFYEQTGVQTRENERHAKMHDLAIKMKAQVDEQRDELTAKEKALKEREAKVTKLEERAKELDKREAALKIKETDLEEREELVLKDKLAARDKQNDLEVLKVALEKKQNKLQKLSEQYQNV